MAKTRPTVRLPPRNLKPIIPHSIPHRRRNLREAGERLLVPPAGVEDRGGASRLRHVRGLHAFLLQLKLVAAVIIIQTNPDIRVGKNSGLGQGGGGMRAKAGRGGRGGGG